MSIPKINTFVLDRLKLQAKLQIGSENKDTPLYKLIKISNKEGEGLDQLPSGSADDIFFDMRSFPLIDGGLEYLWGASYYNQSKSLDFIDYWAHDQEGERTHYQVLLLLLLISGRKIQKCIFITMGIMK